jgi:hypothetical protein
VRIGRPKRVWEVEPVSLPIPEVLPAAQPTPTPERDPAPVPVAPDQPAEPSRRTASAQ